MKTVKTALLLAAVLCGAAGALSADARGYRHHGARIGVFIGAPIIPYYYYPRYYYPPAYYPYYPPAAVSSAPVYVEQSAPAAPAQGPATNWYFCRDSQTYYPYVQQCASPWQEVAPQSSPPS